MLPGLRQVGLREKLILLALLILVPLSVLQAQSIWARRSAQIAAEKSHSQRAAELVAVNFTRYLESMWNMESALGAMLTAKGAPVGRSAMDGALDAYRLAQPTAKCLSWYGPDGTLLATNAQNRPMISMIDRDWFQAVLSGEDRVVSDLLISRFDGLLSIGVARGIRQDDKLVGVMLACINLDVLNEAFAPAHNNTGNYMLIDTTGTIVFHSDRPDLPLHQRDLAANSPARQVLKDGQPLQFASTLVDPDGTIRLGAAVPIAIIGWVAVASEPSAQVLARARADAFLQVGLLATIGASSFAGVVYFGRRILRPVHAVQQAARQLARGDLMARAGAFAVQDELGTLAANFDQMAERLQVAEAERSQLLQRLIGKKYVLELIATGASLPQILSAIVQVMEEQVSGTSCTVVLFDPTGELREGEGASWSTPILAANGEELGVLAVFCPNKMGPSPIDESFAMTLAHLAGIAIEHQNVEEARNRKLQTLIEYMAEGVVAIDAEERVLVVNPAATRLLELEPLPEAPTLAETGLPFQLAEALRNASLPDSRSARRTISCANRELATYVSPVVTSMGRRYGAIALMQDVTAVTQLRKLQESFVANVSHELRAPLASLSAMAEAMNDGLVKGEAESARYHRAILTEVNRLRTLTNEILELSRLDARAVVILRAAFNIDWVFTSIQESWSLRCSAANIRLTIERPGVWVLADYDRVLQVITNLVENAVKFTQPGGEIRVFAKREGESLKILVADTGPGIAKKHLLHIWERFYMGDEARTRTAGSGAGLGLAIARQLVELMDGKVGVTSDLGVGSVFSFSLPLQSKDSTP